MGKVYVIEHMEPDEQTAERPLPEWVLLEYWHILQRVGACGDEGASPSSQPRLRSFSKDGSFTSRSTKLTEGDESRVFFSHLSPQSSAALIDHLNSRVAKPVARAWNTLSTTEPLELFRPDSCTCSVISVLELMSALRISLRDVCLLDPKADQELEPSDGKKFEWFLFGGILGDDPPRDRTAQLRAFGFPSRHLGSVQMTTDTAVAVTKLVVQDQIPLKDLDWVDRPQLIFNAKESVEMPFRYLVDADGEPIMPEGMRELIRKDMDRSLEF